MARREKGGFWVGVAAALFYPMSMIGRRVYREAERIPREGGALLVLNHVSHLDPIVDAVLVHRQKRIPRFLAKEAVAKAPILGRIFRSSGGIPVYRGTTSARDSLSAAHQALRAGKIVVIYPEGTITRDPRGWPKSSYTGAARLAIENDVPVIPIARWGTNLIFDGYSKKLRPFPRKTVTHLIGEPLDLSAYRDQPPSAALFRQVTEVLMGEVTALLAEIREEKPPASAPESTTSDGDGS